MNTKAVFKLVKEIIVTPDIGWQTIKANSFTWQQVFIYITIPMVFLVTLAALIFAGQQFTILNLTPNQIFVINIGGSLGGIAFGAYLICRLAPRFEVITSFNKTVALVSFSFLPLFIANIIASFHPLLTIINFLGLFYLVVLYRKGLLILLDTPLTKIFWFTITNLIILIIARLFITTIIAAIVLTLTGGGVNIAS